MSLFFVLDICSLPGVQTLINLIKAVISIIQFFVPLLLIIFGMLDLGKAVIAGKEDDQKKAQSLLIKRVIYAVAIFFVVTIVVIVFRTLSSSTSEGDNIEGAESWLNCMYPEEN